MVRAVHRALLSPAGAQPPTSPGLATLDIPMSPAPRSKTASTATGLPLGPACRILVLAGKEAFLREDYTTTLRKAIEATGAPVDLIRYDGATALPADVLDECRSYGMLGQHKIVVVDNADQFVKEESRPLVERYAQLPCDSATLVLRCDSWRKGNLDKMIARVGRIQPCDEETIPKATKSAVKFARETYQRTLEPDAAELLIARLGPDLGRIDSELAKLAAATTADKPITLDLVRTMVTMTREEKAWVIQDYLLNPDPEPALLKLRELVEVSRLDPVLIRWAYIDIARKLHAVAQDIARGVPAAAAGRALRLWGPSASAIRSVGSRVPPHQLADLLHNAVEADFRGKTGQGDPVRTLEALTLRFADLSRA